MMAAVERELSGVPLESYRRFTEDRRPPDRMTVWVARRGAFSRPSAMYVHRFFGEGTGGLNGQPPAEPLGWSSTIGFGHLVLQIRHWLGPGDVPEWHPQGVDGVFALQIWPFRQDVVWPALPPLDDGALRAVSGAVPKAPIQ
jgi:hypothetical protein